MSEQDGGTRPDESGTGTPDPAPPAPPAPDWSDTSVLVPPPTAPVAPPPTQVPDAATAPVVPRETAVDPLVPPAATPPVAPGWSNPTSQPPVAPAWPAAAPGAPPAPGQPAYGQPAYGQPAYGQPASGQPAYGQPAYGQPAYGQPVPPAYPGTYPAPALPGVAGWGAVPQAPKPGVIPLRPLGVGEILDGAISYIRRDPKTVLGISALIAAGTALLQVVLYAAMSKAFGPLLDAVSSTSTAAGSQAQLDAALRDLASGAAQLGGALLLVYLVTYVLDVLATGLLTTAMGRAVLGKPVSTSDVWQRAAKRFWPLLALVFLSGLILAAVVVGGLGVAVLIGVLVGQASQGLGVFLAIVLGIVAIVASVWLYVKLLLAPVALVLEGVGPVRALQRSYALVGGAWWRTFGIHLLALIIGAVVSQVITVPFGLIGGVLSVSSVSGSGVPDPFSFTQSLITALSTLVTGTIVVPFSSGVVALLYIDRRIRREALDIELARATGTPGA